MAGHSKWNNIKRKKEKTDSQKAKIFTKVGREISVAVKEGGGADPETNSRLKDAIAKAKANNVPNDNIERVIKKAAGDGDNDSFESIRYEGYGPNGVAVIVECLTDNRNRTAGDLRHFFDKSTGNLGTSGCVGFLFEEKGVIIIEADGVDEDKAMEDALNAGADDFSAEDSQDSDGIFEIITSPESFSETREELEKLGYSFLSAEIEQVPSTFVKLNDENVVKMERLLDSLEDNDDVQNVWHNWEQE